MFYLILCSVFETFQRSLWPCHAQKGLSLSLADSGGKEVTPCCEPLRCIARTKEEEWCLYDLHNSNTSRVVQ